MKALILAAGRGERMRPLTDHTPKPLLLAGGKPLIAHTVERLVDAGVTVLVVNLAYLGEQIEAYLGDGSRFCASIRYSWEREGALETGGGIYRALPLLGDEPFIVVNGDVATDYPLPRLKLPEASHAHLVLVQNPEHNQRGDFGLEEHYVTDSAAAKWTYSGLALITPALFAGCADGRFPLAPILRRAMQERRVTGEIYAGFWKDIGTVERLMELDARYRAEGLCDREAES